MTNCRKFAQSHLLSLQRMHLAIMRDDLTLHYIVFYDVIFFCCIIFYNNIFIDNLLRFITWHLILHYITNHYIALDLFTKYYIWNASCEQIITLHCTMCTWLTKRSAGLNKLGYICQNPANLHWNSIIPL